MRRHFPSIFSCPPHSIAQRSLPFGPLNRIHILPSQPACIQACHQANPLSAFCPISFPPLKNTSFYPTLVISMPSSSCLTKLSLKHHVPFEPPAHFTSKKRSPPTSSLSFSPHQKPSHF
ncbi:rCG41642 [Rattus norvegicus]|uniref:RCG41642 n=1 Tax=Rattus norvegicus TaxID=10116 RepID=A6IH88_RAT|nr:rCG41642 [Rattus norvegicus]